MASPPDYRTALLGEWRQARERFSEAMQEFKSGIQHDAILDQKIIRSARDYLAAISSLCAYHEVHPFLVRPYDYPDTKEISYTTATMNAAIDRMTAHLRKCPMPPSPASFWRVDDGSMDQRPRSTDPSDFRHALHDDLLEAQQKAVRRCQTEARNYPSPSHQEATDDLHGINALCAFHEVKLPDFRQTQLDLSKQADQVAAAQLIAEYGLAWPSEDEEPEEEEPKPEDP